MRICRSRLTGNFVQVPNGTARDDRLSHMARGILVEILSHPDGWETTADDMWRASVKRHGKASPGRRAFRAAFAELKEHGYLVAERAPLASGRHGTVLTAYDIPAAHADVPQGGTPEEETGARPDVPAGGTDVPDAGTPDASDAPDAGTSARPGQKGVSAGGTDVPGTDVPHAGTSSSKTGSSETGKTAGDGRRPTTGSGGAPEGGSAAAATARAAEDEEIRAAATGAVIGLLPRRLRDQLPNPVPRAVTDAIRKELARGLTADQLVERAGRRWWNHGYEDAAESAEARASSARWAWPWPWCAAGTAPPPGVTTAGTWTPGTAAGPVSGRPRSASSAGKLLSALFRARSSGPTGPAPQAQKPAPRSSRTEIRDCEGPCGRVFRTVPAPAPAGMCSRCRTEAAAGQAVNA